MPRIRMLPYKMSSTSGKSLASGIPVKRLRKQRSRFIPRSNDIIINWGSSEYHHRGSNGLYINSPSSIRVSKNKLKAFRVLKEHNITIPEWTTETSVAQSWVDSGYVVFGRQRLEGHSGQGIIIFDSETITSDKICPLYTKRIKRKSEFRVHIINGTIIDIQQKKRRNGSTRGGLVWNHSNGYVYCREGVSLSPDAQSLAVEAVNALGLDFGAVDICINKEDVPIVFEVNTAPGLFGTTLSKYVEAFKEILNHV